MSLLKPDTPEPPDPVETARAQTGTNVATAIANARLGNVNQITPDGSLRYRQSGTSSFTDPTTGDTYEIPQFTAVQRLSPHGQALQAENNATEIDLARMAREQTGMLRDHLNQPLNLDNLPAAGDPSTLNPGGLTTTAPTADRARRTIDGDYTASGAIEGDHAVTRSYGGDYAGGRQRVEDALMARLNPYLDRDTEALESRLAEQGIFQGSEAFSRAMDDDARRRNDARLGAVLGAGEEQTRLAGLDRAAATFENQATAQGFGQALTEAQLRNAAAGQNFGQDLAAGQFENDAIASDFNSDMASAAFGNQAMGQLFGQGLAQINAQDNARAISLNERTALRSQPINEISALLSGSQVSQPNFVSTTAPQMPTVDYAGLVNENYNQRLRNAQIQGGAGQQFMGGLFGLGAAYLGAG